MAGIPIEDAVEQRFENSTRDELLEYCEALGIGDVRRDTELENIKRRLFNALGVAERVIPGSGGGQAKIYRSKIMPPMNLTPSGRWGGRRRRIKLHRVPWATQNERAIPIGWNGKAMYWLPFDEPVAVPYPIYHILLQTKIRRPIQKEVEGPGGTKEITTDWEFNDLPMNDMGDDPATADLPTSLTSFYQDKGPDFFKGLSERDIQSVADRLDVNTIGFDKKRMSRSEIVDAVLIFLYGVSSDDMIEAGAEAGDGADSELVT